MQTEISGNPSFVYLNFELEPGEKLITESDAMISMSADLDLESTTNGGFFPALAKKFLGKESFFISHFTNNTYETKKITIGQTMPGDIHCLDLNNETYYLQPGAYICSTPGVELQLSYAGIASFIGREGLFRLKVSGTGKIWYGVYGAMIEKEIDGEYIVDTSHLVGYEPHMKLKVQLAGGLISSVTSGEGLVTRVEGKGKIVLQSRSMHGLADWTNKL